MITGCLHRIKLTVNCSSSKTAGRWRRTIRRIFARVCRIGSGSSRKPAKKAKKKPKKTLMLPSESLEQSVEKFALAHQGEEI